MVRWRLVTGAGVAPSDGAGTAASPGALNMAVDSVLFDSVRAGGAPVLRLYAWRPACLSLGRNQHAAGLYDEERLRIAGIDVVRRPTGGLAVLHDAELTYCVLAPAALLGGPRATYRRINEALVAALRALGIDAGLAPGGPLFDPRTGAAQPCFQLPAAGEIVAGARKLVGSAQRCEGHTLLQHGSILLGGSQARILDFLRDPFAAPPEPAAVTLQELTSPVPAWSDLVDAIAAGFDTLCGTRLAPGCLARDEESRLPQMQAHYENAAWTWRR